MFIEYRNSFQSQSANNKLDEFNEDIQKRLKKLARKNMPVVNSRYLFGMSIIEENQTIAWFNGKIVDTSALSLSLVHNAMVKAMLGKNFSIQVTEYPLPIQDDVKMSTHRTQFNNVGKLVVIIMLVIPYLSSFYIMDYIEERVSRVKLLQIVSGMNIYSFWMATFLYDSMTFILKASVVVITLVVFKEGGLLTKIDFIPVFITLILFRFSMLPLTFVLSLVFSTPFIGFIWMIILSILISKCMLLILFSSVDFNIIFSHSFYIGSLISYAIFRAHSEYGRTVFLIFPFYTLERCLLSLDRNGKKIFKHSAERC